MNNNQNIMNQMMMMMNNLNNMNPMQNIYQNNMSPMMTDNQQNVMDNYGMMNYPTMGNMNNMNFLNMNAIQNNSMNYLTLNSNLNNNMNNFMNMNQNCNMNNMNNMNSNLNNNSMNNFSMNNMNSNLNNSMNNLSVNSKDNNENINANSNNSNENSLIENLNELNLSNQNESIYQEIPNYVVSAESKLILQNSQIQRGKLVANKKTVSPTLQCAICMDLVMTPVECETCSKLYCKECIDNWLKNSNECPNKHPFVKKQQLDEWIKVELGRIFIKCPYYGCGSDYAYQYWTGHVKKCRFKSKGIKKIKNDNDNDEDTTEGGDEPFVWEKVQFFVKDLHDRTHTFMLPLSTTVRELKEKLEEKTGFKVEAQRLSFNGKMMDNQRMLEFYGLQNDQTIYQLGRLKGGNKNIKK